MQSGFFNRHTGQTCVLVGNGRNLHKTPPAWFDYPSFGMNTIFYYEGWTPTYYVAVDAVINARYGEIVAEKYRHIPKFVPSDVTRWQGENFIFFKPCRTHVSIPGKPVNRRNALTEGVGFTNSMTATMQIAIHMGFSTLLMIGVEQKPGELTPHFWGDDPQMPKSQTDEHWNRGYQEVIRSQPSIRVLNISQDTFVPDNILPRGNWQDWKNN